MYLVDLKVESMMLRCNSEHAAKDFARERGQLYGFSAFTAGWFVGSREQLTRIGVIEPKEHHS